MTQKQRKYSQLADIAFERLNKGILLTDLDISDAAKKVIWNVCALIGDPCDRYNCVYAAISTL